MFVSGEIKEARIQTNMATCLKPSVRRNASTMSQCLINAGLVKQN